MLSKRNAPGIGPGITVASLNLDREPRISPAFVRGEKYGWPKLRNAASQPGCAAVPGES